MNLALIASLASTIFFGIAAIIISIKKDSRDKSVSKDIAQSRNSPIEKEFVHMVVHELRAPLTSIKDSAELLINTRSSLSQEKQEQFLKIIYRESKELLKQISSILDAAKFESGTFVLEKTNENIADIIHERVKLFEPQAGKKNITITTHMEVPIPPLNIDCLRINQVLNNLISNSIKFTPSGGKVYIETRAVGTNVEISVSDTGVGIPREQQANIFSKFYQVKSADGIAEKEGSGLGLYIVKKIIDAHGGTISVESADGKGTKMKLTLPIQNQHEIKESASLPAQHTLPN